jgi:pimeloyl-ACP methyl ester carboxylesterase
MGVYRFAGRDGVELACRETGCGRPLVLLHGFMGAGSHMLNYGRAGGFAAPELTAAIAAFLAER